MPIVPSQKNFPMNWLDKRQPKFPVEYIMTDGEVITILGYELSNTHYRTLTGLIPVFPLPVQPVEEAQEIPGISPQLTVAEFSDAGTRSSDDSLRANCQRVYSFPTKQPKTPHRPWHFTKQPIPQREAWVRAENTRLWLRTTLIDGPRPAAEVHALAKAAGIPRCPLYRAKDFHGVTSICVTGLRCANRWVLALPEIGR